MERKRVRFKICGKIYRYSGYISTFSKGMYILVIEDGLRKTKDIKIIRILGTPRIR